MKKIFTSLPLRAKYLLIAIVMGLWMCSSAIAQLPSAQYIASQMSMGINIGNTLEAPAPWPWNPDVNQTYINAVRAAGFNAIRIPCAWDSYADPTTLVIPESRLAKVKQAVDMCMANNMYAIINIHWDSGWLENHLDVPHTPTQARKDSMTARQSSYWNQIANYFKNYDEHLLFASANEPDVSTAEGMSLLLSYHQLFINTVRATGGNNSSRTLIIQGPKTDIVTTNNLMNTMPTDQIANRLMVEVHFYSPFNFCLMSSDQSWGQMYYYWGNGYHSATDTYRNATWGEESDINNWLGMMKTKFVDQGYPVIVGEWGASRRRNLTGQQLTEHLASNRYYHRYVASKMLALGLKPFFWDTGALFDRITGATKEPDILEALMTGRNSVASTITLKNRGTGMGIDGMWRYANNDTTGQWAYNGGLAQQWVEEIKGNYVKLKNKASGLYLDGKGNWGWGAAINQCTGSTSTSQEWLKETFGNYVKFKNRATGLYLDGMGSTNNGANLCQWGSSSSYNQQWSLTTISTAQVTPISHVHETTLLDVTKMDEESKPRVGFYPNPFTSSLNLTINNPDEVDRIEIFDLKGARVEVIKHALVKKSMLVGASLKPDVYILRVYGKGWSESFKVIKQ